MEGYPECVLEFNDDKTLIGNGICDTKFNTSDCGYDDGDCFIVKEYPNCIVDSPSLIGDGICTIEAPYNTADCGFDGGDCVVDAFPNCISVDPVLIGNELCDNSAPYNTAECGFDGGDCIVEAYPDCELANQANKDVIGDGFCETQYNTTDTT